MYGLTVRATMSNIFDARSRWDRTVFVNRRDGPISFIEDRDRLGLPTAHTPKALAAAERHWSVLRRRQQMAAAERAVTRSRPPDPASPKRPPRVL